MLIQLFEISYQYKLNITVILFILTIMFLCCQPFRHNYIMFTSNNIYRFLDFILIEEKKNKKDVTVDKYRK